MSSGGVKKEIYEPCDKLILQEHIADYVKGTCTILLHETCNIVILVSCKIVIREGGGAFP